MEEFHMPLKENFQELVQHGKSDFPIQYYVNSLHIAGNSVPLHWHPNLEFFVVHCGMVHIQAGNADITLEAGQGIFLNTNCLHSYESVGKAPCYCSPSSEMIFSAAPWDIVPFSPAFAIISPGRIASASPARSALASPNAL